MRIRLFSCLIMLCASQITLNASALPDPPDKDSLRMIIQEFLDPYGVEVSGHFFIAFEMGDDNGEAFSDFFINRGYINVKKEFLPGVFGRITPDISVDREGDGEGDLEMRLKYCYVGADLPDWSIFTQPSVEFGLVERPWLGFEQKVNTYRVQGYMFLESNGILNSSDFGACVMTLFGGEMPQSYTHEVNSNWPGRYGSLAVGIFNGGGYHAIEQNINKTLETRASLRPLPGLIPGLQFTYAGVIGKGNRSAPVDWNMHVGFISFEHRYLVFTGTYFSGTGDFKGSAVDEQGIPIDQEGFSVFTELRLPKVPLSLIARFDRMRDMPEFGRKKRTDRIIAGLAYRYAKKSKVLIDYETAKDQNGTILLDAAKFSVEYAF
ncbi:MAG: hypothetical protein JXA28_07785 [Bacteroidetes bacterium]|nr:hypothetical protein [Bacteroidota bacterium]